MLIDYQRCIASVSACHGMVPRKVLHIGAHTGEEAAAYHQGGVQEVIWFEANQALIAPLQAHVASVPMRQQIVPLALWNTNTRLSFKVTNNPQSSSFFDLDAHARYYPGIQVVETREVDAYRLDSLSMVPGGFLSFLDFEFINIDTQGAELAILQGFGDLLLQASIKAIYLEVNREQLYKDIPVVSEIDRFLLAHGFHRMQTAWTGAGWGDALYLKAFETQL